MCDIKVAEKCKLILDILIDSGKFGRGDQPCFPLDAQALHELGVLMALRLNVPPDQIILGTIGVIAEYLDKNLENAPLDLDKIKNMKIDIDTVH